MKQTNNPTTKDATLTAPGVEMSPPPDELQGRKSRKERERRREAADEEEAFSSDASSDEDNKPGAVAVDGVFTGPTGPSGLSQPRVRPSPVRDPSLIVAAELAEPSQEDEQLRRRMQELEQKLENIIGEAVTGTLIVEDGGAGGDHHDQDAASSPFGRKSLFLIGAALVLCLVVGVILGVTIPSTTTDTNGATIPEDAAPAAVDPAPAAVDPAPAAVDATSAPVDPTSAPVKPTPNLEPPSNVLASISSSVEHSQCVSYSSHALATDGVLNNRVTGDNCGNVQHLVYDLGSQETVSELKYVYCTLPGFSNGAVNGFSLSVGNTIDGTYNDVLSGNIPEDVGGKTGQELSFPFTATSGRYWKFSALTNHGNGSYIWTCEVQLY
jgi:hypothetical protein